MSRWSSCPSASRLIVLPFVFFLLLFFLPTGWSTPPESPARRAAEVSKIPIGTVLPVSLESALSSKGLRKGEAIQGRIMQEVPLLSGGTIPAGSKVLGTVVDVASPESGTAGITLRFTSLESNRSSVPIVVALRAMASYRAVQTARAPYQEGADGGSSGWATTLQIGGDIRYGDGGKVTNRHRHTIGQATRDAGVLARLDDPPGSPCEGWPDQSPGLQSLWVFSADACGLYDLNGLRLAHAGNKEPLGDITLSKDEGEIKIMKSSALLLRVVH